MPWTRSEWLAALTFASLDQLLEFNPLEFPMMMTVGLISSMWSCTKMSAGGASGRSWWRRPWDEQWHSTFLVGKHIGHDDVYVFEHIVPSSTDLSHPGSIYVVPMPYQYNTRITHPWQLDVSEWNHALAGGALSTCTPKWLLITMLHTDYTLSAASTITELTLRSRRPWSWENWSYCGQQRKQLMNLCQSYIQNDASAISGRCLWKKKVFNILFY